MEFFVESRHLLGRSALVFSGGGLFGMFHFGKKKNYLFYLFQKNFFFDRCK
jgi:hypothetical protein